MYLQDFQSIICLKSLVRLYHLGHNVFVPSLHYQLYSKKKKKNQENPNLFVPLQEARSMDKTTNQK